MEPRAEPSSSGMRHSTADEKQKDGSWIVWKIVMDAEKGRVCAKVPHEERKVYIKADYVKVKVERFQYH